MVAGGFVGFGEDDAGAVVLGDVALAGFVGGVWAAFVEEERGEDGDLAGLHFGGDGLGLEFRGDFGDPGSFLLVPVVFDHGVMGAGDEPDAAVGDGGAADGGPAGDVFEGVGMAVTGVLVPGEMFAGGGGFDGDLIVIEVGVGADEFLAGFDVDGEFAEAGEDRADGVQLACEETFFGDFEVAGFGFGVGAHAIELFAMESGGFGAGGGEVLAAPDGVGDEVAIGVKLLDLFLGDKGHGYFLRLKR